MTKCDFCKEPAKYDGKTAIGPWAYMCEVHFLLLGIQRKGFYTELGRVKIEKEKKER